nr:lon protease homolog 2, peroxisomal-like isoform X2 [Tanacetum cinerariifolium]
MFYFDYRGVAARALHLSRGVEKPSGRVTYIVVLEGLSRFSVEELNTRGTYTTAKISPIDMTKAGIVYDHIMLLKLHNSQSSLQGFSVKLVEEELWQREEKGLIGILPVRDAGETMTVGSVTTQGADSGYRSSKNPPGLLEAHKIDGKSQHEPIHWHTRGVAARALHLSRGVEKPSGRVTYIVVLEGRLKKMQPQQPGYNSSRVYLELLADLPWETTSEEVELDLKAAKDRLDSDHYGLVKVKQRIIEYLAVRKLKPDAKSPVLCFVGPPGVGKTSLASSIAAALGRKFIRISLGGVKDEADIRGHRRTYIGSMPGRLIDGLKKVGVCNPVMLLDEIDKTGSDVRGDPASALLEVLDPEQNKTFNDHYLNVPFDLSKVIFVGTANRAQPIPPPLLDRMEVIELPGYTSEEKLRIAMRHLIPRVLSQHGLNSDFLQFPEGMVKLVIERYTREAGVRSLERNLAALARAAAVTVAEQEHNHPLNKNMHPITSSLLKSRVTEAGAEVEMEVLPMGSNNHDLSNVFRIMSPLIVDEEMLEKVLGPSKYDNKEAEERVVTPGVTVGLVWTAFGGEVQFVEATATTGKGDLHLTGQLGDVIKESAQIALTWVRARASELNLVTKQESNLLEGRDVHIHFPAGAVPKDGPSAGVTLVTSLVSLFSRRRVRADTAMTGEMTLRGLVLPVGGIKDKVLAAHRYGLKKVILPERNKKDLVEVPAAVLGSLEILFAKRMEDVLEHAFEGGCPLKHHSRL